MNHEAVPPLGSESEVRVARLLPQAAGRFSRDAALLVLALALLNGSNYAFHIVLSRLLGPTEYGALAALLALLMVLSVPFGVLQTVIAKRVAIARGAGDDTSALTVEALRGLRPFALGGVLLVLAASPLLAAFLEIGTAAVLLLAPYVAVSTIGAVPTGTLQGRLEFGRLAAATLAGVTARLGFGIGLVAAGFGVAGAVAATAAAQLVQLGVSLALARVPATAWRSTRGSVSCFRGEFRNAVWAFGGFWLLAEVDIILARRFLDADDAGFYSGAGLVARGGLFVLAAVSIAALPRFAERGARNEEAYRWLRLALLAVVSLALCAVALLALLRDQLVAAAFGPSFEPASELLPLVAVGVAFLAVVNVLVAFHVAAGTRAHVFLFAGVGAEAVLIQAFHGSPEQVAVSAAVVAAAVAVLQFHAAKAVARWAPLHEGAAPLTTAPSLELSVVVPCHNPGGAFHATLDRLRDELRTTDHEVIVVSDGSTDETIETAQACGDKRVRVLEYPERVGKGHALRVGLAETRGRYVAFIDADGDIDPCSLRPLLELMRLYEPDVVLASKRHPLSDVSYPWLRRVLSWGYHKLTRLLFRVNVRDTQTGLKLIRRDVLAAVLPRMFEKRYAFDLEFLVVARLLGFTRLFEAPVRIDYRFASGIDPRATFRIFVDTLAVFYRRQVLASYGVGRQRPAPPPDRSPDLLRLAIVNWRDIRNPAAGGAEIWTHEVARRWAAAGHAVMLVTSRFPGSAPLETVDGVRIRRVGRLRTGSFHALAHRELGRVRDLDAVVESVNTIPFFTPLRRDLPPSVAVVYQLALDVWEAELPRPVAAVARALEPRLWRPYAGAPVVAISESTRTDLERLGVRDVSLVHPGCDEPPRSAVAKEPVPTFLYVGRLVANKRPDHAIAAFRTIRQRLPDARLWIVGRGPLERALNDGTPEGVDLLGYVPRDELYERMARAHCLLVPSVREGWGLVVIEANAVGTPAVGYDVAGVCDSIRDGRTGVLAPAGDAAALGRAAAALVCDAARYRETQAHAAEWAARFTWDATANALLDVVRFHAEQPAPARTEVGAALWRAEWQGTEVA